LARKKKPVAAAPVAKNPSPIRTYAIVCAILLAAVVVTYWKVYADSHHSMFLGASDSWQFAGGYLFFADDRLHDGELPLWNPLYFCGQPFAANPQSFLFSPPNLLRSALTFNPTPIKTHIGIVTMVYALLVLAGATMFAFARRHGLSFGASLLSAFGFAFSGLATSWAVGHWYYHLMMAWLPLLFLLTRLSLDAPSSKRKAWFAGAAGMIYGFALLGGHAQFMVSIGFALGVYVLLDFLLHPVRGEDAEASSRWAHLNVKRAMPAGLTLAAVAVLGVLIAAALLFPALDFVGETARSADDGPALESRQFETLGWNLAQLLVIYPGDVDYGAIEAAGAGVLLLALFAFAHPNRREWLVYGLLFLVMLDSSLDEPWLLGRLHHWIMPIRMGDPNRTMLIACLPLALLAGMGLDAALRPLADRKAKVRRSLILAGLALPLLVVLLSTVNPHPVLAVSPIVIVTPAVIAVAAIVGGWSADYRRWSVIVALVCFGETLAWNQTVLPSVLAPSLQYPGDMKKIREPKEFWNDNRRYTELSPNANLYNLTAASNGFDPLFKQSVRNLLCSPDFEDRYFREIWAYEVTSENQRGNLFLKRPFWLARQYVDGPLPGKEELFPSTTTVFLDGPGALSVPEVPREALRDNGVSAAAEAIRVFDRRERPHPVPIVPDLDQQQPLAIPGIKLPPRHSVLVFAASSSVPAAIQPNFKDAVSGRAELGKKVLVTPGSQAQRFEVPVPDFTDFTLELVPTFLEQTGTVWFQEAGFLVDGMDEDAKIHVIERTANTVEVEVRDLDGPRILTFLDAYYPGWTATVNGAPVDILRANQEFKAVELGPGTHRVRFEYRAPLVYAGIVVSLLTFLGLGVVLAATAWRARRISTEEP
jgi:hypothetical protein